MTAVEEIRRAATLMRERANAATPGPWHWDGGAYDGSRGVGCVWTGAPSVLGGTIATPDMNDLYPRGGYSPKDDMQHVASWHPLVALAVADWLDNAADWHGVAAFNESPAARHAQAVARAYLGGQP